MTRSAVSRRNLVRSFCLIDDDPRQRCLDGLLLESELFPDGDEDRRTGGGCKGEVTRPGRVVGRGLDLGCFQLDVERGWKPGPIDHRTVEVP